MLSNFSQIVELVGIKKLIKIQITILLNTVAELAIIVLIPLFLTLIANPTLPADSKLLSVLTPLGLMVGTAVNIKIIGLLFFGLIAMSNCTVVVSNYKILKFCAELGASFSDKLFKYYLSRDYLFFVKSHSSQIINDIVLESQRLTSNIVFSLLTFISRLIVTVGIVSILLAVNPEMTLIASAVIVVFYFLFFKVIKKKLAGNGVIISELSTLRFKYLNEAFSLIKELKIFNKETIFAKKQYDAHLRVNVCNAQNASIAFVSKYFFETMIFGAGCFAIYTIHSSGTDLLSLLPTISLYLVSIYKLLPTVQALFNSYATLKSSQHILDQSGEKIKIGEGVQFLDGVEESKRIIPQKFIKLKNLSFSYDGLKNQLNNVTLEIPVNKKIAFVGASGAGKTTAANIILGMLKPTGGQLYVDDRLIDDTNREIWSQSISFISQNISLMDESAKANITLFEDAKDEDVFTPAKNANIHDFILSLEKQYESLIGDNGVKLSGGQRQRIGLARALYFNRPVMIFDEATSALDNANEFEIMKNIDNIKNKTIIVIAHRLSTIRKCDIVFLFDEGRLVDSGNFFELKEKSKDFENLISKEELGAL